MKLKVIYEPAGRAREYAPLACNPWIGCTGGCVYCYAKHMARKEAKVFHCQPYKRIHIERQFTEDCLKLMRSGDDRIIFLSFMCDPFQKMIGPEADTIYAMLKMAWYYKRSIRTLTKVPSHVRWSELNDPIDFGVSISSFGTSSHTLEPGTDLYGTKLDSLETAKRLGHTTWVSMEPVLDPEACLQVLREHQNIVDFWRIGKLNARDAAMKKIEMEIDWKAFGLAVRDILPREKYMLKEDLLGEMGEL